MFKFGLNDFGKVQKFELWIVKGISLKNFSLVIPNARLHRRIILLLAIPLFPLDNWGTFITDLNVISTTLNSHLSQNGFNSLSSLSILIFQIFF